MVRVGSATVRNLSAMYRVSCGAAMLVPLRVAHEPLAVPAASTPLSTGESSVTASTRQRDGSLACKGTEE